MTPEGLKLLSQKIAIIRFPTNSDKPYKIFCIPENCDVIDVYEKLNFIRSDIKIYCDPKAKMGGKFIMPDKIKNEKIKALGFSAQPFIDRIDRNQKNSLIDLTSFANALKLLTGSNFNTPRSEYLHDTTFKELSSDTNFYNCVVYITDSRMPLTESDHKKYWWLFYFHYLLKQEQIPNVDSLVAGVITDNGCKYIKVYDKKEDINNSRFVSVMKTIKGKAS